MRLGSVAIGMLSALALNLVWENSQAALYKGYGGLWEHFWICAVAAVGDVAIVAAVHILMALIWSDLGWYRRASTKQYLVAILIAMTITIVIEYWALVTGRWQYNAAMPLIPYTRIGLVPLSQMMIIVPIVFLILRTTERSRR